MSDFSSQPISRSESQSPPRGSGEQFVHWKPEAEAPKPPSRLYHKKSRYGCKQCRARRVKCDVVHPICGNCHRHKVSCDYVRPESNGSGERLTSIPRARTARFTTKDTTDVTVDLADETPETRKRRELELKLLYLYMTNTGWTVSIPSTNHSYERGREIWVRELPGLALKHDSLLYAMYCIAAMHLAKMEPQNAEALEACSTYFGLAIRSHQREVDQLNNENADVVLLTSSIIRLCALVILQDRELSPYTPPTEWLQMTKEAGYVFVESYPFIRSDPTSLVREIIEHNGELTDQGAVFQGKKPWDLAYIFRIQNPKGLAHLLERNQIHERDEPWNSDIEEVYKKVLSFIGTTRSEIVARKDSGDILRLLIFFPILIQKLFVDLVNERHPRALVLLAHYFALFVGYRNVWWIGDIGQREIIAIQSALPVDWRHYLDWPLQIVREGSVVDVQNSPKLSLLNLSPNNS